MRNSTAYLVMQEKYQQIYDVPTELVHNVTNINAADRADTSGYAGSLLPPVSTPLHRGGKLISFKIDKWGFKDDFVKVSSSHCMHHGRGRGEGVYMCKLVLRTTPHQPKHNMPHLECSCCYSEQSPLRSIMMQGVQDAFVTISLVDGKGNVMGRPQDTPTTNNLAGNYVLFNYQVK